MAAVARLIESSGQSENRRPKVEPGCGQLYTGRTEVRPPVRRAAGVADIHDLPISPGVNVLSGRVVINDGADLAAAIDELCGCRSGDFDHRALGVPTHGHATVVGSEADQAATNSTSEATKNSGIATA